MYSNYDGGGLLARRLTSQFSFPASLAACCSPFSSAFRFLNFPDKSLREKARVLKKLFLAAKYANTSKFSKQLNSAACIFFITKSASSFYIKLTSSFPLVILLGEISETDKVKTLKRRCEISKTTMGDCQNGMDEMVAGCKSKPLLLF